MCKIIVVAAQKGGVGKTSTVRNLSYSLAELGKRVLAVDFDPQFSLTTCFGVDDPEKLEHTTATLMTTLLEDKEFPPKAAFIHTVRRVDLIPSSIQLSVIEANLRLKMGSEHLFANLLESLRGDYDYILVDTCPSLGTLTISALTAADEVMIPVNPQLLAVMGYLSAERRSAFIIRPVLRGNCYRTATISVSGGASVPWLSLYPADQCTVLYVSDTQRRELFLA